MRGAMAVVEEERQSKRRCKAQVFEDEGAL
jgi:hypothetical protein